MIRRPPRSTRTDTLFPYTTVFRSHQLIAQQICINGNGEAHTPILQPLQMAFDQPRLATCDAKSLEQPIAVGQSSIMNGQPITGLPVQPAQCHSAKDRKSVV